MKFRSFFSNGIFFLNVLLIVLFIFRSRLSVPVWLQPAGRMHPMLLHLPIGILIAAALMVMMRSSFKKKSFQNFLNYMLYMAAFTAALTAVFGIFLSQEGGYAEVQLQRHLITGVLVSLITWWVLMVALFAPEKQRLFNFSLGIDIAVMLLAGHFGSVLTHGENFVLEPLSGGDDSALIITDSTSLYAAAIEPVFKAKCVSCHNEKKAKGKLIMTLARISEGGKDGPIWVKGDPANSALIKRIHLPESSDDHMPPEGKPQLTDIEKKLLYQWVLNGANLTKAWTLYPAKDSLRLVADRFIQKQQKPVVVHYPFEFANPEVIEDLNSPWCSVAQIALDEPALKADFFLSQQFDSKKLEALLKVKEQLVILNLAGMPVTDNDGKTLSQFIHLEKLSLNKTNVSPKLLASLKTLPALTSLSLAGSNADQSCIPAIVSITSLKEVFLWNSKLSQSEIETLASRYPAIRWNAGYHDVEILKLTPPLLVNESPFIGADERVILKHNLRGTQIRYSIDGTAPDSVNGLLYHEPVSLSGYTELRAQTFKEGWYGSPVVTYVFFIKGIHPLSASISSKPDKNYKGDGANTLVNNSKGSAENLKDINWLGFREVPMVALFEMPSSTSVGSVTFSYALQTSSFVLPPASIELWAGDDPARMSLVEKKIPLQPSIAAVPAVKGIIFHFSPRSSKYYKIVASQVARVPAWITVKPERGWVFCDEVIFQQQ